MASAKISGLRCYDGELPPDLKPWEIEYEAPKPDIMRASQNRRD
jgi:hypothetical protein